MVLQAGAESRWQLRDRGVGSVGCSELGSAGRLRQPRAAGPPRRSWPWTGAQSCAPVCRPPPGFAPSKPPEGCGGSAGSLAEAGGDGFRFQRFRQSPRHLPSLLPPGLAQQRRGEAGSPQPGGGGCGDWEGTGWVHPPARRLGSSVPGDAVSGSRAVFKKLNTIFGNPPVGILPPHAAQYPLPSPFSFLPPPLPPPAPSPSHPSAYNPSPTRERRERVGKKR